MTTTTEQAPDLHDTYTNSQIARLAALQGVAGITKGAFGASVSNDRLIELAEYVIGEDDHYDHCDEYDGYNVDEDDPGPDAYPADLLAEWEIELLDLRRVHAREGGYYDAPEPEVFTVSDLEGFLTLPTTAILEDQDGDTWAHDGQEWSFLGGVGVYDAREIFEAYGDENGEFHFVLTNPEVLAVPVVPAEREVESVFALDLAGLLALPDSSVVIDYVGTAWQRGYGSYQTHWTAAVLSPRTSVYLADRGPLLVVYVPGDDGFPQLGV